jgi:hypothetical protein
MITSKRDKFFWIIFRSLLIKSTLIEPIISIEFMKWIKIMNFEPIVYLIRKMWKNDKEKLYSIIIIVISIYAFLLLYSFFRLKKYFYIFLNWLVGRDKSMQIFIIRWIFSNFWRLITIAMIIFPGFRKMGSFPVGICYTCISHHHQHFRNRFINSHGLIYQPSD